MIRVLENHDVSAEQLSRKETWRLQQRWRETFLWRLKDAIGKWKYGEYEWHAFSYGYVYALSRDKALQAYLSEEATEFYALPEHKSDVGYFCTSERLPDLTDVGAEIHIVPPSFSWTMVFTHEDGRHGPYFTRREWCDREMHRGRRRR